MTSLIRVAAPVLKLNYLNLLRIYTLWKKVDVTIGTSVRCVISV